MRFLSKPKNFGHFRKGSAPIVFNHVYHARQITNRREHTLVCCYDPLNGQETHSSGNLDEFRVELVRTRRNTKLDVLGLGQAMIDFAASVDKDFVEGLGVTIGGRKVIDVDERSSVMESVEEFSLSAGGSLSNSLVGLGNLARASSSLEASSSSPSSQPLRLAMSGLVGGSHDHLSLFYQRKLGEAGVEVLLDPRQPASSTGTVMVLTDRASAHRTFLSYPGSSQTFHVSTQLADAIISARVLMIEGYLFEFGEAVFDAIAQCIALAKLSGTTCVMTCGDPGIVQRYGDAMRRAMSQVDIVFCNAEEARLLAELPADATVRDATDALAERVRVAVVTDGANGSYVAALGETSHVDRHGGLPAQGVVGNVVDTCGAGDAYAAGFLYALLEGVRDVYVCGQCGAWLARHVVAKFGNTLTASETEAVLLSLQAAGLLPSRQGHRRRGSFEQAVSA